MLILGPFCLLIGPGTRMSIYALPVNHVSNLSSMSRTSQGNKTQNIRQQVDGVGALLCLSSCQGGQHDSRNNVKQACGVRTCAGTYQQTRREPFVLGDNAQAQND